MQNFLSSSTPAAEELLWPWGKTKKVAMIQGKSPYVCLRPLLLPMLSLIRTPVAFLHASIDKGKAQGQHIELSETCWSVTGMSH